MYNLQFKWQDNIKVYVYVHGWTTSIFKHPKNVVLRFGSLKEKKNELVIAGPI